MFIKERNLSLRQRQFLNRQLMLIMILTSNVISMALVAWLLPDGAIRSGLVNVALVFGAILLASGLYRYWYRFRLERIRTEYDSY